MPRPGEATEPPMARAEPSVGPGAAQSAGHPTSSLPN